MDDLFLELQRHGSLQTRAKTRRCSDVTPVHVRLLRGLKHPAHKDSSKDVGLGLLSAAYSGAGQVLAGARVKRNSLCLDGTKKPLRKLSSPGCTYDSGYLAINNMRRGVADQKQQRQEHIRTAGGDQIPANLSYPRLQLSDSHSHRTNATDTSHDDSTGQPVVFYSGVDFPYPENLSDSAIDDVDQGSAGRVDVQRTKAAIDQLHNKIMKTMALIRQEQQAKEANVNEYLQLSANADKQQGPRIKAAFEKKNQKSTQTISHLQRKLENYQKRLKDTERFGICGSRQAKEVLKDMGQGLKEVGTNIKVGITGFSEGVVGNIKGATGTIVQKPKEFAHLIHSKFGSADNIASMKFEEITTVKSDDGGNHGNKGSGTLPPCFKYHSQEDIPASHGSLLDSSSHYSADLKNQFVAASPGRHDVSCLYEELQKSRDAQISLTSAVQKLKNEIELKHEWFKHALEEARYHSDRLEEQINDITELHQHEMTNMKQELLGLEEKMEYQLEERTRDMQDLLESCQTKISKMELQQHHQQVISMEGFDNSNVRTLITKLINVVLALLAVILVLINTLISLVGPFLTTRLRCLTTFIFVAIGLVLWRNWDSVMRSNEPILHSLSHWFNG